MDLGQYLGHTKVSRIPYAAGIRFLLHLVLNSLLRDEFSFGCTSFQSK